MHILAGYLARKDTTMVKTERPTPSECPCCYQPFDGENVYWADGAYNCRLCRVQFQAKHAEPDRWYFLLTSDLSSRFDRIDDAESYSRQRLDRVAEKMNTNLRHNARKARVIERGELGHEREERPTTLAEVFFGKRGLQ